MSLPTPKDFDPTPFDIDDDKDRVAAELAEVWEVVEKLASTPQGRKMMRDAAAKYEGHEE